MATRNTEGIKFSVTTGNPDVDNRIPCIHKKLTYERICAWIDSKKFDPLIAHELKKSAGKYPENALEQWKKNYQSHLTKIRHAIKLQQSAPKRTELGEDDEPLQAKNLEPKSPVVDFGVPPDIEEFN